MGVLTPNFNTMDLVKILEKNQKLQIQIVAVTLQVTSCRTMSKKKKVKKSEKPRFYGQNKLIFENPAFQPLGSFSHMAACRSSSENTLKNELNTCFQQKFATGSYGVRIGRAWCSRIACEICSSLVQKKKLKKNYFSLHKLPKLKKNYFSLHKLPKQQSTRF
jgi:hypothetical protein